MTSLTKYRRFGPEKKPPDKDPFFHIKVSFPYEYCVCASGAPSSLTAYIICITSYDLKINKEIEKVIPGPT